MQNFLVIQSSHRRVMISYFIRVTREVDPRLREDDKINATPPNPLNEGEIFVVLNCHSRGGGNLLLFITLECTIYSQDSRLHGNNSKWRNGWSNSVIIFCIIPPR